MDSGAKPVTWDATGCPRQSTTGLEHAAHAALVTALQGQAPADVAVLSRRRKAHKRQAMIDAKRAPARKAAMAEVSPLTVCSSTFYEHPVVKQKAIQRAKMREQQRLQERRSNVLPGDRSHTPRPLECLAPCLSAMEVPLPHDCGARPEHELSSSKARARREKSALEARLAELQAARTAWLPPPHASASCAGGAVSEASGADQRAPLTWAHVTEPNSISQHVRRKHAAMRRATTTSEMQGGSHAEGVIDPPDTAALDGAISALDALLDNREAAVMPVVDAVVPQVGAMLPRVALHKSGAVGMASVVALPEPRVQAAPKPDGPHRADMHARAFSRLHVHSTSIVDKADEGLSATGPSGLPPHKPPRIPNPRSPAKHSILKAQKLVNSGRCNPTPMVDIANRASVSYGHRFTT